MSNVSISDLRQHLPEYLAKVARGQTVRVTVRGRAVAQLVPATADADEANAARHRLHGSLVRYEEPFEPTLDLGEWEMNR